MIGEEAWRDLNAARRVVADRYSGCCRSFFPSPWVSLGASVAFRAMVLSYPDAIAAAIATERVRRRDRAVEEIRAEIEIVRTYRLDEPHL